MSTHSTTSAESDEQRCADYVAGLRELADHLELNPELIQPFSRVTLYRFADDRADFRELTHTLGGHRDKRADNSYYNVRRAFGPHVLEVTIERAKVCRKVVTGTRLVPAVPAQEEGVEDIVEWVCDDPILAGL